MSNISIRGNLTAAPELRFTQSGKAVATVTVAENVGKDDQKRTNFHRVTLWGELAEHAASLEKGTSVLLIGRLDQRDYESRDGEKRTSWDVTADAFGPDLRFQTVTVSRAPQGGQAGRTQPQTASEEPWSTPANQGAQGGSWEVDPNAAPF